MSHPTTWAIILYIATCIYPCVTNSLAIFPLELNGAYIYMAGGSAPATPAMAGATISKQYNDLVSRTSRNATHV